MLSNGSILRGTRRTAPMPAAATVATAVARRNPAATARERSSGSMSGRNILYSIVRCVAATS